MPYSVRHCKGQIPLSVRNSEIEEVAERVRTLGARKLPEDPDEALSLCREYQRAMAELAELENR